MGTGALFNYPTGVAVDAAGNLYVADAYNDTVRKITSAGAVTTLAGSPGLSGATDLTGANALFNQPAGLAVDSSGNVYVADTGNCTIRRITSSGAVTTVAGIAGIAGFLDGAGTNAFFNQPRGLLVDGSGNLVVADTGNAAIRKIDGNATVSTPAMTTTQASPTTSDSGGTTTTTTTSGGGGGGAPSVWFTGALALLGISRWLARKR
jgi:streptogramin lyase